MHEWREFDRRGHIMVARPIWSGPSIRVDVSFVLYAGPPTCRRVLERAADALGVEVSALVQPGVDPAQACWKDVQRDSISLFGLSERDPQEVYRDLDARPSKTGLDVVRGDVAEGQDIIESIWEETARADQVIVDLTGFNLNVCLELGMADTLGRPTVLTGERGTEQSLFPAIAKRRCHTYSADFAETPDFLDAIERWSRRARAQSPEDSERRA